MRAGLLGSESDHLSGSGGEGGIGSSRRGSGSGHVWTYKDKAVLFSVGSMLFSAGSAICDFIERSYWCHSAACKDFESQHTNREICNWTAFGLSLVGIGCTITAIVLFYKSTKTTTIN